MEIGRGGKTVKEIALKVDEPNPQTDSRMARKLDGGDFLVRHEADRLDVVEGLRVTLAPPGAEPLDGLVVRVRREPPFAWVELTPRRPVAAASRAG